MLLVDFHNMSSRSCRARFPADHGRLDAAVESRQLNRILACLAALARLGVTPRFARPKHLASLGRVTALPRFARPGLALQVVKLCGCRIRGITCPAASKMRGRLTSGLPSSRLLFAFCRRRRRRSRAWGREHERDSVRGFSTKNVHHNKSC